MSIIPLFASYLLIYTLIKQINGRECLREASLITWIIFCSLVLVITEIFSLFNALNYESVLIFWSIASLIAVGLIALNKTQNNFKKNLPNKDIKINDLIAIAYIFTLVTILLLLTIYCPPNTWDSMTYHMSRVAHWVQNENVSFYPTHILRQLHQPPFAEYLILQLQLLNNGDRFANIPQFASMIISTLGITLIAKEFNLKTSGQVLAALISISVPMGILQSTSTQNDYVLTAMIVSAMYFAIKLQYAHLVKYLVLFSASIALALSTKGTGYLFAIPIIGFALFYTKKNIPLSLKLLGMIVIACAVFNAGHYLRNFNLYGSILGPGREGSLSYANEIFSIQAFISNLIRNIAIHLGTPIPAINLMISEFVNWLHHLIGISASNPKTTWGGIPFLLDPINPHEDGAGNFIHLLLIFISLFIYFTKKNIQTTLTTRYIFCIVSCFFLFFIYLKWQPWHSRLQLPIFILWSPLIAMSLVSTKFFIKRQFFIILCIFIASLPWTLFSATKPLIAKLHSKYPYYKVEESIFNSSRNQQYFMNRPKLWSSYKNLSEEIIKINEKNIGLIISGDEWEYPLFPLLHESKIKINHIAVQNDSAFLNTKTNNVNLIIEINQPTKKEILFNNKKFVKVWSESNISLYQFIDKTN
jgi:hypothetical protein